MTLPVEFHEFTPLHALSTGVCIAIMVALCVAGLRLRDRGGELKLRWAWVAFVWLGQACNIVFFLLPWRYDPAISFPLQLCDLAGLFAAAALVTRARWVHTTLFYWGFGLCTQAFITPTLLAGPALPKFWLFWISHLQIVATALYIVIVLRYRPTWRDYGVISGIQLIYGAIVIPLDFVTGWNYGFAGQANPTAPTIVDSLGSWPLRLFWMWLIGQVVFAVLTFIFSRPALRPLSP